jgi:acyl-CoA oxidase
MMNDEQQKEWIPKVRNMEILGTYAKTEIGHGSDIAGLRTTATFDVEK